MSKLARVKDGKAQLPSGKKIEVGFRQWFDWLEHPDTKSFRVDDGEGYTARKETAKGYWYAYRKVEGKLHKRYIGISEALTVERLAEVGELFSVPSQPKLPKLPKPVGNLEEILRQRSEQLDKAHDDFCKQTVVIKNLQNENAELRSENAQLFRESVEKSLERSDMLLAKQKEVETFIDNQKLQREIGNLQKELAEVRSQLSSQTELPRVVGNNSELHTQLGNLQAENEALKVELAEVRSQLEDFVTRKAQLKAKMHEVLDEQRMLVIEKDLWQGRLSDAAHDLKAEQNKRLQANDAVRKLEREISELRSQLSSQTTPQDSKILELPDAATLLNQLKSDRKKSKADLGDVEAILEMIEQAD